jgi:hypothetical protein
VSNGICYYDKKKPRDYIAHLKFIRPYFNMILIPFCGINLPNVYKFDSALCREAFKLLWLSLALWFLRRFSLSKCMLKVIVTPPDTTTMILKKLYFCTMSGSFNVNLKVSGLSDSWKEYFSHRNTRKSDFSYYGSSRPSGTIILINLILHYTSTEAFI